MDYNEYSVESLRDIRASIIKQREVMVKELNDLLDRENAVLDALKAKSDYVDESS